MVKDCNRHLTRYADTEKNPQFLGTWSRKKLKHFQLTLLVCEKITTFQQSVTHSYCLYDELEKVSISFMM